MQQVILLGRRSREQARIETKIPLKELKIIHKDETLLAKIAGLEFYVQAELNVKSVSYLQNEDDFIEVYAKPNYRTLGRRLGKRMVQFKKMIEILSIKSLDALEEQGYLDLAEERFSREDIIIYRKAKPGTNTLSNRFISVELNIEVTPELQREGLARKITVVIQRERRKQDLELTDRIHLHYWATPEIQQVIEEHDAYIMRETLTKSISFSEMLKHDADKFVSDDEVEGCVRINGHLLAVQIHAAK
jgi:isoleucyl-tRNA synthetase